MFINSKTTRAELLGSINTMFQSNIKLREGEVFSKLNGNLKNDVDALNILESDLELNFEKKDVSIKKQINNERPLLVYARDSVGNYKTSIMLNELSFNINKCILEISRRPRSVLSMLTTIMENTDNLNTSIVFKLKGSAGVTNVDANITKSMRRMKEESIRFVDTHDLVYIDLRETPFGEIQFDITPLNTSSNTDSIINQISAYLNRHGKSVRVDMAS